MTEHPATCPPHGLLHGVLVLLLLVASACTPSGEGTDGEPASMADASLCDPDDGGLELPDGFCAYVVADSLGNARHLAVRDNGDIYVMRRRVDEGTPPIVALRDTDEDGRADVIRSFGAGSGTGLDLHDGYLYASSDTSVYRYGLDGDALVPEGEPDVVVRGFPAQRSHAAKSLAFDEQGHLYVNVGAPANACQQERRTQGSPGEDPCPLLEEHGGIWRFDADSLGQTHRGDGYRFATGLRNVVALAWNPLSDHLYGVQHGRDQLHQLWPDLYTVEDNAELPAEEFFQLTDGGNYGWPYCYYDQRQEKKVLAPEYGGDGQEVGRCDQFEDPILAFPGHWAPNDVLFYTGAQFPVSYRDGAFIAFHGSWNRAPEPQAGYKVVFVPFDGAQPADAWTVFADAFAGEATIENPGEAQHRPMGLAQGPDGSLYISDSVEGRVWRVLYVGDR